MREVVIVHLGLATAILEFFEKEFSASLCAVWLISIIVVAIASKIYHDL
jgi:hypothetical protein